MLKDIFQKIHNSVEEYYPEKKYGRPFDAGDMDEGTLSHNIGNTLEAAWSAGLVGEEMEKCLSFVNTMMNGASVGLVDYDFEAIRPDGRKIRHAGKVASVTKYEG